LQDNIGQCWAATEVEVSWFFIIFLQWPMTPAGFGPDRSI
jgi:hypothetical protein